MQWQNLRIVCLAAWLAAMGAATAEEPAPAPWVQLGKTGGSIGGAVVYSPTRRQILRWGGLKSDNEVRHLDVDGQQWVRDYERDRGEVGGNFCGGQRHAAWIPVPRRPAPFFLFRQACWDSLRHRMIIVALNLTAAYDPETKNWTDLRAVFQSAAGERREGRPPGGYDQPWFAPVPGQCGSCAYDAVNDEILLFPLWITQASHRASDGAWLATAPELPDDAGVRAGHYGTFIFNCKTNAWRLPELGGKEMLAARQRMADLINGQREAARAAWKALLAFRQEKKDEAAKRMIGAAEKQEKVNGNMLAEKTALEKMAGQLTGYEADQVRQTLISLDPILSRAGKARAGLANARPDELPALHARQQAIYRELRLVRDNDLYVQPLPRCSTSVVYDSTNKVIVMAGGDHLDRRLNDTWVYDCKTRRWQRKAPAPEAADWPGMCYDSKRGRVLYAAEKATYAYDAAKDQWFRIGAGRPRADYADMAYDESRDLVVLIAAGDRPGADEIAYAMKPPESGAAVQGEPEARETTDEAPFPPPAEPGILERLKTLPVNVWTRAQPNVEPMHRSSSTMSWDPALRCVIYQGRGHAGTMDNTISAYFPECNKWVNAFPSQYPPRIFGAESCAGEFPAYERGMGLAMHGRYYESFGGLMVHGAQAGFDWATREHPADFKGLNVPFKFPGGFCLYPERKQVIQLGKEGPYDPGQGREICIYDLARSTGQVVRTEGPVPQITAEWSGIAVHPDKNWLVVHGAGDNRKAADNETWVLDLSAPKAWKKLELKRTTPAVGMAKLNAIPGTDLLVCAMPSSNDLWVLSLDRRTWKPLPAADGHDKLGPGRPRFDLYGQCVWDPAHGVFVMAGLRGDSESRHTFLLRPDFSKMKWD